ncbi:PTS beta-glucoside transporter subunit EIIBCA, partial [Listeria monocytogenes]|nr:PTS beta-glucoside transporter subunit EIIBCA [Listeria monocytogenes]
MDKKETAKLIVERLGGKENINMVTHCATRLRFDIKNKQEIQEENLNSMEEILGIVDKGGQYQLVLGPSVNLFYNEVTPLLNDENVKETDDKDINQDEVEDANTS